MGRVVGRDDEMTMRIVGILLSMSCLALRANFAPFASRCLLLAALHRAEAIARVYALGAGVPALAPVRSSLWGEGEPAVAAHLGLRMRMLALTLLAAVARHGRSGLPRAALRPASAVRRPVAAIVWFAPAPAWPDTS